MPSIGSLGFDKMCCFDCVKNCLKLLANNLFVTLQKSVCVLSIPFFLHVFFCLLLVLWFYLNCRFSRNISAFA